MQRIFSKINKNTVFGFLILLSPFLYFFIGLPEPSLGSDASGYSAYATHLVEGKGYSLDGTTFSNFREPGYSLILALTYGIFGIENTLPMVVLQTLLLGVTGILIFVLFLRLGERAIGLIAALSTTLLPSYGMYAHRIGTESIFTFLLVLLFYVCFTLVRKHERNILNYVVIGILCGSLILIKAQTLFFLPFLVFLYVVLTRRFSFDEIKKLGVSLVIVGVMVSGWIGYVYSQTGTYSITSVRPEMALYLRGVRAQLSYAELTQYGRDWVHRSLSGGKETQILSDNEYHTLQKRYMEMATTSEMVAALKKESIHSITSHLGQYLYGNLIEVVKLAYIEHDYSDFLNKYVRAGMYLVVYALFAFGLVLTFMKRKHVEFVSLVLLALIFLAYNFLILTPLDTIPRYNTPYLVFYMLVGFVGFVLFKRKTFKEPEL